MSKARSRTDQGLSLGLLLESLRLDRIGLLTTHDEDHAHQERQDRPRLRRAQEASHVTRQHRKADVVLLGFELEAEFGVFFNGLFFALVAGDPTFLSHNSGGQVLRDRRGACKPKVANRRFFGKFAGIRAVGGAGAAARYGFFLIRRKRSW